MHLFLKNKNILLFYLICLLNIAGMIYFLVNKKSMFYVYCVTPAVILILFLAVFKLDTLVKCIIFFTPISVSLKEFGLTGDTLDLSFPTEPILAGIMLIFIFNEIHSGVIESKFWKHPVTIVLLLQILWTVITSVTSTMPLVSFKYLVVKLWFVSTAYFLYGKLFKDPKNIVQFIWLYVDRKSVV